MPATDATPEKQTGLSTRAHVLLLASTFFFIFMGTGAQQAFLVPYLADFTDWSQFERALVIATVYFSMMIFRLGNVYLLRDWPQWKCSLAGGAMYVLFPIAMLGLYFLPSYPLALVAAAIWGWGGAAMWMGTTLQVLALADRAKRHGTGMGVLYGATHVGWAVGVVVLGAVFSYAQGAGISWLLYAVATTLTLIGYGIMLALPRRPEPLPEMPTWASLMEITSRAKARIAAFLLFSAALAFGFVLGSFTDYVERTYGAQWLWIATFFYPFSLFVLSFSSGLLSERMSHGSVLSIGFFGGAAAMAVPLLWESPVALAITALMLGLLNGAVPVVSTALIGASSDRTRRPLVYGAMFTWRDLGVVVAAVAGSLLGLRPGGVALTFGVFAVAFLVCGVVALVLNRYAEERL
ncbi:MAG: MFS transporter [Armatimonadota bacterium]|jgi:predicted MFS family arabinose efflux permease